VYEVKQHCCCCLHEEACCDESAVLRVRTAAASAIQALIHVRRDAWASLRIVSRCTLLWVVCMKLPVTVCCLGFSVVRLSPWR
jgi:hypothetical protein